MITRFFSEPVILVFIASILLAQASDQKKQSSAECESATTTAAMHACENERYLAAQRRLDDVYEALLKRLDSQQKVKLRRAQQAWLRCRDANAEFQASMVGDGSLAPLIRISVLTEMTNARAAELEKQTVP